jgi:hypothetical protein
VVVDGSDALVRDVARSELLCRFTEDRVIYFVERLIDGR